MRARLLILALSLVALSGMGCTGSSDADTPPTQSAVLPIVYGEDDREEYFEVDDPALQRIARRRAVALMTADTLVTRADRVELDTPSLLDKRGLCEGARFAEQPAAAVCSGFLVDERTVLTAGHCALAFSCDELRIVRSYFYTEPDVLAPIRTKDVFSCDRIVAHKHSGRGAAIDLDYAFIRLERPVAGLGAEMPLRGPDDPLEGGEPLTLFGCSEGVPLKIDRAGRVVDPRLDSRDFFVADFDAFVGDSGGAVLDSTGKLVGVDVRGGIDYAPTEDGCSTTVVQPDDPAVPGEQVTYAFEAFDALCRSAPETPACCTIEKVCPAAEPTPSDGCSFVPNRREPSGGSPPLGSWIIVAIALRRRWTHRAQRSRNADGA